jgi:hypothetical protein
MVLLKIITSFCVFSILSAYSENTKKVVSSIGKYLSVHEEYDEVRTVCGTQNPLQIRGKYSNLFGEYVESI